MPNMKITVLKMIKRAVAWSNLTNHSGNSWNVATSLAKLLLEPSCRLLSPSMRLVAHPPGHLRAKGGRRQEETITGQVGRIEDRDYMASQVNAQRYDYHIANVV